jgi:hypothetical protein
VATAAGPVSGAAVASHAGPAVAGPA